jgi:hypothetical protein
MGRISARLGAIADDPTLAAGLMQATASQNRRVDEPVYQLSLSFAAARVPSARVPVKTSFTVCVRNLP